jgi:hypothetical protein
MHDAIKVHYTIAQCRTSGAPHQFQTGQKTERSAEFAPASDLQLIGEFWSGRRGSNPRRPAWEGDGKWETKNVAFPCTSFWRLGIPRFHSVLCSRHKRSTNGAHAGEAVGLSLAKPQCWLLVSTSKLQFAARGQRRINCRSRPLFAPQVISSTVTFRYGNQKTFSLRRDNRRERCPFASRAPSYWTQRNTLACECCPPTDATTALSPGEIEAGTTTLI